MLLDNNKYEILGLDIDSLIAWLKEKNPRTKYDFMDCDGDCLVGRYLIETTGKSWQGHGLFWADIIEMYSRIAIYVASEAPYTYGAALKRALKVKREEDRE